MTQKSPKTRKPVMNEAELNDRLNAYGLKPPRALTLMITQGCNLKCRHCLVEARPRARAGPVAAGTVIRKINEFAALNGQGLTLTGGEVLTHPDWLNILSFGLKDTDMAVCLQTNAGLITAEVIDRILALPTTNLTIQVSLDGALAPAHDRIRGQGSFEKAVRGLKQLSAAGLGPQTRVAFTETNHNFDQLPRVIDLTARLGLTGLISGTLVKSGRAKYADYLDLPSPEQYRRLINQYLTDPEFQELYDRYANISAIEWYKGRDVPGRNGCNCLEGLYLTAEGRLHPCPMLLHPEYARANALEKPLPEVIDQALTLWAQLPQINKKRQANLIPCQKCPGRAHCGGGCLGRALAAYGKPYAVEDRCALRRAVYGLGQS